MLRKILIVLILLIQFPFSECLSQTTITGVINQYTRVTDIFSSNSCTDSLIVSSSTGFNAGDSILLIQMQGAEIDSTNTANFGTITNYENSGNYEFAKIKSMLGNSVILEGKLNQNYTTTGIVQMVSKPVYSNATVIGTLSAQPWNGNAGGVCTFSVTGTLTLNGDIDVSGMGFRGGPASTNYYATWYYDFCFGNLPGRGGKKGESISPYILNKEYGRGPQAAGGGGGNDINTGGAGGGNYGQGGHGGNNFFSPDTLWGMSGYSVASQISSSRIFMGSGGGGGHQNNSVGTDGSNGGGIVLIHANTIDGNSQSILANGIDITAVSSIDGGGGGGAGGTILLDVRTINSNLDVQAKGGKGGDQVYVPQCHGNGGGGGGGVILYSNPPFTANVTTDVSGGLKGSGQCNNTANDAADGDAGNILPYSHVVPVLFTVDAGPDTTICQGTNYTIGSAAQTGINYQWNNGVNTPVQTVNPPVTTTYILTAYDGTCLSLYDSVTVYVNNIQQPSFIYTTNCFDVTFTNGDTINNYQWFFGDGDSSTIVNPLHSYSVSGNYNVTLIASNGMCVDSITQTINILPSPQAIFNFNPLSCNSTTIQFDNQTTALGSFLWLFGDGNTSNAVSPSHSYSQYGQYNVTLIAFNCDTDSISQMVQVDSVIVPVPNSIVDSCSMAVHFSIQNAGQANAWYFGDGNSSLQQNITHTFSTSGNYTVTLVSQFAQGCTDTSTLLLNIPPLPNADFSYVYHECDSVVTFSNHSTNGNSYEWNFGDGDSSSAFNATHLYSGKANITVTLSAMLNGCVSSSSKYIHLVIPVVPEFDIHTDPCSDSVVFIPTIKANSYRWDFGDRIFSSNENPVHEYLKPGIYPVSLTLNKNSVCPTSVTRNVDFTPLLFSPLYLPDAFTPNNDGINDNFHLNTINNCEIFSMIIYNRWGNKIFETPDALILGWDGTYNSEQVEEGVYVYMLHSSEKDITGKVAVIR